SSAPPSSPACRPGSHARSSRRGTRADAGSRRSSNGRADTACYHSGVSAQGAVSSFGRRVVARARAELRLTGLAIWRGALGIYNSNDLTFASSIAYYALLSLFPF